MSTLSKQWHSLFCGSVPKDPDFSESNEDKLRISDETHLYVMSDGASESYNSALWADVLVTSVFPEPPRSRFGRWLKRAITTFEELSNRQGMSWSQEAAFARGSFASLLVVQFLNEHITVTAIGDSVALMIENGAISRSFPYTTASQFQSRPHLLCTIPSRHNTPWFRQALRSLVSREALTTESDCMAFWSFPPATDSFLVCVTDALGEWLLRQDDKTSSRLNAMLAVRTQDDLMRMVEAARSDDGMRRDDSSLIILGEGHATSDT